MCSNNGETELLLRDSLDWATQTHLLIIALCWHFHVVNHEKKKNPVCYWKQCCIFGKEAPSENYHLVCLLTWGMCNDGSLKQMPFYCNCSRMSLKAIRTCCKTEDGWKMDCLYVFGHHDTCNCLKLRACVFVNLSITGVPLNISLRTRTQRHTNTLTFSDLFIQLISYYCWSGFYFKCWYEIVWLFQSTSCAPPHTASHLG